MYYAYEGNIQEGKVKGMSEEIKINIMLFFLAAILGYMVYFTLGRVDPIICEKGYHDSIARVIGVILTIFFWPFGSLFVWALPEKKAVDWDEVIAKLEKMLEDYKNGEDEEENG